MEGTVSRPTQEHFVRELGKRWEATVPIIPQVAATRFAKDVFQAWGKSGLPQENFSKAVTLKSNFESPWVMESAITFAYSGILDLTLTLDDRSVGRNEWGRATEHEGQVFSLLVCGRAICGTPLTRQYTYSSFTLLYSWASERTLAAITSALVEARKVECVTYEPDEMDEHDIQPVNHSRWLAFALFSNASNGCVVQVDTSKFRLTERDVVEVAAVMKTGYPGPVTQQPGVEITAEYGYVEVQKGTFLRPVGLPKAGLGTIQ